MRPEIGCDLHFHSCNSDGRYSPSRLASILARKEVRVAALTDHDTALGFPEFFAAAAERGIIGIPAVELTTWHEEGGAGCEIHLLGYGLRYDEKLIASLTELREQRNAHHRLICRRLAEQGYVFDYERLRRRAHPNPIITAHYVLDYVARHPLWAALGLVTGSLKRWYDRFAEETIGPGGTAYLPPPMKLAEGIAWIRRHEGLVVLAHPSKITPEAARHFALEQDIDGIEVFYQGQEATQDELLGIVRARSLIATGGSDWHGYFGGPYPGWRMPPEHVNTLLERLGLPTL